MGRIALGLITFGQYARRLDIFVPQLRHGDMPHDAARLLELARATEQGCDSEHDLQSATYRGA